MRVIEDDPGAFQSAYAGGLVAGQADAWPAPGERVPTFAGSPWAHLDCTGCGQTFARGDVVVADESRTVRGVRHLDTRLACADHPDGPDADSDAADIAEAAAFADGILDAWAPQVDVVVLEPGHPLIARRPGVIGGREPRCLKCARTFRPGETVILCPCGLGVGPDGRPCQEALHRDPAAGLPCWEERYPTEVVDICPTRLDRVHQ